jgi:voltage-gated potassium channel Kch
LIYIIALVVNQIFAEGTITVNKIAGGVAVYILLGHLWSSFYLTIYIIHPSSFQYGGELIQSNEAVKQLSYFSFVTLTTIGYGDIIAVSSVARIVAILEGLLGQLFPAIFIAKLVSLQIEQAKK